MITFPGRSGKRAFTLIELLVAAAIVAGLAVVIAVLVRNLATTWTRNTGRMTTGQQAQRVLDQLETDLQGAWYRDDGNVWLAIDIWDQTNNSGRWEAAAGLAKPSGAGGSLQLDTDTIEDARFGEAGVWLRFLTNRSATTLLPATETSAAPIAVGYQMIRRFGDDGGAPDYFLHRWEVRPAAQGAGAAARPGVIESGYDITADAYNESGDPANDGSIVGDPAGIRVPGRNSELSAVLADHVIDFGVRAYVHDPSTGALRLIFPTDRLGHLSITADAQLRSTTPSRASAENNPGSQPMPEVIDVMLRILTTEGSVRISDLERNHNPPLAVPAKYNRDTARWWWGVAIENSHVYTRRIIIGPRAG